MRTNAHDVAIAEDGSHQLALLIEVACAQYRCTSLRVTNRQQQLARLSRADPLRDEAAAHQPPDRMPSFRRARSAASCA